MQLKNLYTGAIMGAMTADFQVGMQFLADLGVIPEVLEEKFEMGPSIGWHGHSPAAIAKVLEQLRPAVVLSATGGSTSQEVLGEMAYMPADTSFVGMSDITLYWVAAKLAGNPFPGVHCDAIHGLARAASILDPEYYTEYIEHYRKLYSGEPLGEIKPLTDTRWTVLRPGKASGKVFAGTTLRMWDAVGLPDGMCLTRKGRHFEGEVLCLETVLPNRSETVNLIRSMATFGMFDGVEGVVLGRQLITPSKYDDLEVLPVELELADIIERAGMKGPILHTGETGFGHTTSCFPIPLGAQCTLNCEGTIPKWEFTTAWMPAAWQ